jgi:hypothetical protein
MTITTTAGAATGQVFTNVAIYRRVAADQPHG